MPAYPDRSRTEHRTGDGCGEEGYLHRLVDPAPELDGYRPALGAWTVGGSAAGRGTRETIPLVGDDGAAFVSHRIPTS